MFPETYLELSEYLATTAIAFIGMRAAFGQQTDFRTELDAIAPITLTIGGILELASPRAMVCSILSWYSPQPRD